MTGVFLNNWSCLNDMIGDFWDVYSLNDYATGPKPQHMSDDDFARRKAEAEKAISEFNAEGFEVVLASYGTGSYEGDAFVFCRKDGKLFEVNASHCSCFGLEGQWSPEETTIEALRHRLEDGRLGSDDYTDNTFKDELVSILNAIEGR